MNDRRITTHEAMVKTATVEIRVLSVSGKQVTLAVYRQLKEEPLIDYATAELLGVPWGTVNYHPGTCVPDLDEAYGGAHLHVVWQKGEELRRSTVWRQRKQDTGEADEAAADAKALEARCLNLAHAILAHAVLHGDLPPLNTDGERYDIRDGSAHGFVWHIQPSWEIRDYLRRKDVGDESLVERVKRVEHEMHAQAKLAQVTYAPEGWRAELEALGEDYRDCLTEKQEAMDREARIQTKYVQGYIALEALDQLFIAV